MKLSISIQASTKTTQITVPSENSIVVGNEETDLSAIPNNGMANGGGNIIGNVWKDGAGINTLTVLTRYVPSSTKWNGQDLQELDITDFIWRDAEGAPILDGEGQEQPLRLFIEDFIVPAIAESTP